MRRLTILMILAFSATVAAEDSLKVGSFAVDASPPVGSPLAYDPTTGIQDRLSCRGIVIVGAGQPIVLCAVDWIGIGNESNLEFRDRLAKAVGSRRDRVSVHTLHQHDAPRCDFSADRLLIEYGVRKGIFDSLFARQVVERTATAARKAMNTATPVTHVGFGEGVVEKVASNRRILGDDGKVKYIRWSASRDPKIRAMPVGTIDEKLKLISLWKDDQPIIALTYYATHPQSYYRTGLANPDFPGMARDARQKASGVVHVHFNGAGGNIVAGKWNDGSKANRQILADRVADGMKKAWRATRKMPIAGNQVHWKTTSVALPPAPHLEEQKLLKILANKDGNDRTRFAAADDLVWLRRCRRGDKIDLGCLSLGPVRVLHMPGELFIEYQLAAQKMRPDLFVAMAAYGDYGPGYIGTEIAYGQGGYETSAKASKVAPQVEKVLVGGMKKLLGKK